jgi:hypothetical protein
MCNNLATVVESPIDVFHGVFSELLRGEFNVGISNDVLAEVVDDYHLLDLTKIAHFREHVFVELLEPKHLRLWGYLVMAFSAS